MSLLGHEIECPSCGEVVDINGLIGPTTDDCPYCGANVFKPKTVAQAINQHYGGHVADGSSIQAHSAGLLYPYVIQMQEMTRGDFAGMWCATILPDEPGGAWYSVSHNTAYDAAQNHILTVLKAPKG